MMNFSFRQLDDSFLSFANLTILRFDASGALTDIRPHGSAFCGWESRNCSAFDLRRDFLEVNGLAANPLEASILGHRIKPDGYAWRGPDGEVSSPHPTLFKQDHDAAGEMVVNAMINTASAAIPYPTNDLNEKYYYQAVHLPGLIHNINGPIGTIIGRADLLRIKHPNLRDVDEIIQVGSRLRSIVKTFSTKVNHENYDKDMLIDLNRFISQEISFLDSDLFFKHNVMVDENFCWDIPAFTANYAALSGIISTAYRFFRQFVNERAEYRLTARTFRPNPQVGFELDLSGPFNSDGCNGARLPIAFEGFEAEVKGMVFPGLDIPYLSKCMGLNGGRIQVIGARSRLRMRYIFSIKQAAQPLPREENNISA